MELIKYVLDHGSVRLTTASAVIVQPGDIGGDDSVNLDLLVVRAARTSYNAAWRAGDDEDKDEKLIHSLMRRQHTGPFEHASLTFEVIAPIFVFRQWHRHRTQSYSEMSGRYTELPDLFYVPDPRMIGEQSASDKQARIIPPESGTDLMRVGECEAVRAHHHVSYQLYEELLKEGWPRELARTVLPVATYSKMVVTANLLNWFRFLNLRCDSHAQYEIRVYADAILEFIRACAPVSAAAFEQYWNAK
jgi:thymidylate synthase (FAD)